MCDDLERPRHRGEHQRHNHVRYRQFLLLFDEVGWIGSASGVQQSLTIGHSRRRFVEDRTCRVVPSGAGWAGHWSQSVTRSSTARRRLDFATPLERPTARARPQRRRQTQPSPAWCVPRSQRRGPNCQRNPNHSVPLENWSLVLHEIARLTSSCHRCAAIRLRSGVIRCQISPESLGS